MPTLTRVVQRMPIIGLITVAVFATVTATAAAAGDNRPPVLGRGINFSGLESASDDPARSAPPIRYYALARRAGFATVRLPVRFSQHAALDPPYALDPVFLSVIDTAITAATQARLNIIVTMQHHRQLDGDALDYGEIRVDPARIEERFVALWTQIAQRYRTKPSSVLFELYNEPHGTLDTARWNGLLARALGGVRAIDRDRWIVVGPVDYNKAGALQGLDLPEADRNLIVSIHNYEPFYFTSQGAEWIAGSSAWLGTKCCSPEQIQYITQPLDLAVSWTQVRGRPLFVGEFGSYAKAELQSRIAYTRLARSQIERRGLSWAYWEFDRGFGLYNRSTGAWNTRLRDALVKD